MPANLDASTGSWGNFSSLDNLAVAGLLQAQTEQREDRRPLRF
jgi:hypothetical protein